MAQLVGRNCAVCQERIPWELDARFCEACDSPVHIECSLKTIADSLPDGCRSCGAPRSAVQAQAELERERVVADRSRAGLSSVALGVAWIVGGLFATVLCSGIVGSGRFIIATGALFAGVGLIVRGIRQSR